MSSMSNPKYGLFSQEIEGPNNLRVDTIASGDPDRPEDCQKTWHSTSHEFLGPIQGGRTVFFLVEGGRSMGLMGLMVDNVDIC